VLRFAASIESSLRCPSTSHNATSCSVTSTCHWSVTPYIVFFLEFSPVLYVTGEKRKKSAELRKLLGSDPISLVIKKGRLRWFGCVEHLDQMLYNDRGR